jgi:hypothetical protein
MKLFTQVQNIKPRYEISFPVSNFQTQFQNFIPSFKISYPGIKLTPNRVQNLCRCRGATLTPHFFFSGIRSKQFAAAARASASGSEAPTPAAPPPPPPAARPHPVAPPAADPAFLRPRDLQGINLAKLHFGRRLFG